MANWFHDTKYPLFSAGATSAIYIGESMDASPTPIPPRIRYTMKFDRKEKSPFPMPAKPISGQAEPIAEKKKRRAASFMVVRLPSLSAKIPPLIPPIMHPISALDTVNPSREFAASSLSIRGSIKNFFIDPTVPEITAVSYPNSNPPKAAAIVIITTYLVFFCSEKIPLIEKYIIQNDKYAVRKIVLDGLNILPDFDEAELIINKELLGTDLSLEHIEHTATQEIEPIIASLISGTPSDMSTKSKEKRISIINNIIEFLNRNENQKS